MLRLRLLLAAWATGVEMLTAPNAAAGDTFGSLMAADGDVLAIGSPEDDDLGTASGSATVFRWSGTAWKFEQALAASDEAPFNRIGSAVAVSGDRIIAGAPWQDIASGAAYVFRWDGTTWTEEAKLVAFGDSNPGGDIFAITVAIDGDGAVGGADLGLMLCRRDHRLHAACSKRRTWPTDTCLVAGGRPLPAP